MTRNRTYWLRFTGVTINFHMPCQCSTGTRAHSHQHWCPVPDTSSWRFWATQWSCRTRRCPCTTSPSRVSRWGPSAAGHGRWGRPTVPAPRARGSRAPSSPVNPPLSTEAATTLSGRRRHCSRSDGEVTSTAPVPLRKGSINPAQCMEWTGLIRWIHNPVQSSGFELDWIRNSPTRRILDWTGSRNVKCVSHI